MLSVNVFKSESLMVLMEREAHNIEPVPDLAQLAIFTGDFIVVSGGAYVDQVARRRGDCMVVVLGTGQYNDNGGYS